MLARCGRVAHICEANSIFGICFPCCNCIFWNCQIRNFMIAKNKLQIRTRQRGNCSMPAGKSRGGTPFCRTLKIVFPRSRIFCKVISRCNCSTGTVAKYPLIVFGKQGGAVLFAPPRKAVAFLTTRSVCQKHGTGISLPAGSDQGYSPWTSPAFLKNCWIKKLFSCLRLVFLNSPFS